MKGKSPDQNQRDLFRPLLADFIDMSHELVRLADTIDWLSIENESLQATLSISVTVLERKA